MFGTPAKPNGSFVQVTPRSRAFESAIALATADDDPEEAIRFAPGLEYMTSVCKTSSPSWLYLDP